MILHFPLTKIIIGLLVIGGVFIGSQYLFSYLFRLFIDGAEIRSLLVTLFSVSMAVLAYAVLFRFYEQRKVTEVAASGLGKNLLFGLAAGFGLQALSILVIFLFGGYKVVKVNTVLYLLPAFTMAISSGIFEELIFRGVIFRLVEEKLGSYIALLISALIFGLLHMVNPNSSLLAGLAIALEAGVLLGVAYMYTRNLWFPIAIHFAWNFTQGGIFGAPVSGTHLGKTLIQAEITGADWYTGGSFGPENSVQTIVFCVLLAVLLFLRVRKDGGLIRPFWVKQ